VLENSLNGFCLIKNKFQDCSHEVHVIGFIYMAEI